jgi:hypothetical protein
MIEPIAKEKDLRVWWVQNVPNDPIYFFVKTIGEGLAKLLQLAASDLDRDWIDSNAGGLQINMPSWNHEDDPVLDWHDLPVDPSDRLEFIEMCRVEAQLSVTDKALDKYFGEAKWPE